MNKIVEILDADIFFENEINPFMNGYTAQERYVIVETMKEFAKAHVEMALQEAAEKAKLDLKKKLQFGEYRKWQKVKDDKEVDLFKYTVRYDVDRDSILKSYPLENIK